jgi:hypothetical protein
MGACFVAMLIPFFAHELAYKIWIPRETEQDSLIFWTASAYLVFISFFVSSNGTGLDILPVIFMSFAIGLINELEERLSEFGKGMEVVKTQNGPVTSRKKLIKPLQEARKREMIKCIEIHLKIKEFTDQIHENFSMAILIQGFMSSIILCMGLFALSVVSFVGEYYKIKDVK